MPAPAPVRLFTLLAYQAQCMADDVDFYVCNVDPDPSGLLASYRPSRAASSCKRLRMLEMGLHCEEAFLRWRAADRAASSGATRVTYDSFSGQVEEFLPRIALGLVAAGHLGLTERALRKAESGMGYLKSLAVMRRAAERCRHDSRGYDPDRLREMCEASNAIFVEIPEADHERAASLRRSLGAVTPDGLPALWDRRSVEAAVRAADARDRRVLKRSIKVSERFVGAEPTRLFVSGRAIRVTGRRATFELTRNGSLLADHGAATLAVHDREDGTFLCRLCLYTQGVPVLDHVVSVFLHVLAGEEEALLREGNAYDVAPEARERDWLVPHLDRTLVPARPERERDGRDLPLRRMVRDLAQHFFETLGGACPPMPETRAMLAQGCTQADIRVVPPGEDGDGYRRILEGGTTLGVPALAA